jgi:hypothetical protein
VLVLKTPEGEIIIESADFMTVAEGFAPNQGFQLTPKVTH